MTGEMWVVVAVAGLIVVMLMPVLLWRSRRRAAEDMVLMMAGPVRSRVDGRVQFGHRSREKGHVLFCADGVVVSVGDRGRFIGYDRVSDVEARPDLVRFKVDGRGTVTIYADAAIPKDVQVGAAKLAGDEALSWANDISARK